MKAVPVIVTVPEIAFDTRVTVKVSVTLVAPENLMLDVCVNADGE